MQKDGPQSNAAKEIKKSAAENMIREYLERAGVIVDTDIPDHAKAVRIQIERQENYKNVHSLLKMYRHLVSDYEVFLEDFKEKIRQDTTAGEEGTRFFEQLSSRLELMSVSEEQRFERTYRPQIATGRRLSAALDAVRLGMRMLEKEDPEACRLLDFVYISGERKPAVRETMKKFHYGGVAVYYGRMKNAEKKLTKNIFGYANNQAELTQILSYLRQMFDDEVSIDMVKHF